ncbi:hypothetical protein U1Q18_027760, partial [Sarracenia purpurea var. burkii]
MGEENHEVSDEDNVNFELRVVECEKEIVDEKIKILRDKKSHIAAKRVGSGQKAHIAETGDTHPNLRFDISRGGGRSGLGNHRGRGGRLSTNNGIWRERTALNNTSSTKEATAHQVFEKRAKPRNWAGLLNPSRCVMDLTYIDPESEESDVIEIEDDQVDEEYWERCLVGYFLDANQAFRLVRATTRTLWSQDGLEEGLPAICKQCKSFGHETTKYKPVQQEEDQYTWTTINKGKSARKFIPRSVQFSDISSTLMGPREATEDPTPLISEPLRKEKDNAARPPSHGNQFAQLDEDVDNQGDNDTKLPDSVVAEMDNPMDDSECEHDQATPTQKAQLSNQSLSKQNNKKPSNRRKQK